MKIVTKLFAVLLVTCMVFSACSNPESSGNTGNSTSTAPKAGSENTGSVEGDDSSPVTYTIYMEDITANRVEEDFKGIVSRKITEDTGVTIKYNFGIGDVSEQVTLMIADRSYPDFVFSRSHLHNFLEADAFVDLAPLIDQYGPNIKKLYGSSFEALKDDEGHIYYLGQNFVRTCGQ